MPLVLFFFLTVLNLLIKYCYQVQNTIHLTKLFLSPPKIKVNIPPLPGFPISIHESTKDHTWLFPLPLPFTSIWLPKPVHSVSLISCSLLVLKSYSHSLINFSTSKFSPFYKNQIWPIANYRYQRISTKLNSGSLISLTL